MFIFLGSIPVGIAVARPKDNQRMHDLGKKKFPSVFFTVIYKSDTRPSEIKRNREKDLATLVHRERFLNTSKNSNSSIHLYTHTDIMFAM